MSRSFQIHLTWFTCIRLLTGSYIHNTSTWVIKVDQLNLIDLLGQLYRLYLLALIEVNLFILSCIIETLVLGA